MAAKDTSEDVKTDDQDNDGSLDMSQAAVKKMIGGIEGWTDEGHALAADPAEAVA